MSSSASDSPAARFADEIGELHALARKHGFQVVSERGDEASALAVLYDYLANDAEGWTRPYADWRKRMLAVLGQASIEADGESSPLALLAEAPVVFGLRAQGHLPTVERMISEGASWQAIGQAIGWDGATAERYYEMEQTEAKGHGN